MSNPINTSGEQNFKIEVLDSKTPVLVDFWAPWCGPCQMMIPVLEQLSNDLIGKLKIVKIDVEDAKNQQLAAKYQIQSIPSLKVFVNGQVVKEFVGFRSKESLSDDLKDLIV